MSNYLELTPSIYKKGLKWNLHKDNQIDTFAFSLYYFASESVSVGQKVLTEMTYNDQNITLPMTRNDIKIQNESHAFYVNGQGRTSYYNNGPYNFCKGFAGVIMAKASFTVMVGTPVNNVNVELTFKGQTKEYNPSGFGDYYNMRDGHNSTEIVAKIDNSGAAFSAEWTNSSRYTDYNDPRNSLNVNPFVKDVLPAKGSDSAAANLPPADYIITKWTGSTHTGTWWSSTRYSLTWQADNWRDYANTYGNTPGRTAMWPAVFYDKSGAYTGTSRNDQRIKYLKAGRVKYTKKVIKLDDYHYQVDLEVPIKYIYSAASKQDWADLYAIIVVESSGLFDGKMFYEVINSIQADITGYKYVDNASDYAYSLYNGTLTTEVENNSILKIARNEFIKNDTTVNGITWDQYWPLRVLSKYKQGKYIVECDVPADWAIENKIECNKQVKVLLPNNDYIGQVVSFSNNYSIESSGKSIFAKILNRDYIFDSRKMAEESGVSFIINCKNVTVNMWTYSSQTALLTLDSTYNAITKIICIDKDDSELATELGLETTHLYIYTQDEEGNDVLVYDISTRTMRDTNKRFSFVMNTLVNLDNDYRTALDKVCPSGSYVLENRSNVVRAHSIFSIKNIMKRFKDDEFIYTLKMIEEDQEILGIRKVYAAITALQTRVEYFFGAISTASAISRFDMKANKIHIRLRYSNSLEVWRDYYVGRVVINRNERTLSTYRWITGTTYATYERFNIDTLAEQEFIVTMELEQSYSSSYNLSVILNSLDGYIEDGDE